MKMRCPHCHVRGAVDATMGGRVVKCPRCLTLFRIPVSPAPRSVESLMPSGPASDPTKADIDWAPVAPAPIPDTFAESIRQSTAGNQRDDSADLSERHLQDSAESEKVATSADIDLRSSGSSPTSVEGEPMVSEGAAASADRLPASVDGQNSSLGSTTDFPDLSAQSVAWEAVSGLRKEAPVEGDEQSSHPGEWQELEGIADTEQKVEEELAALLSETCNICGKTVHVTVSGDHADSRLCDDCGYDLNAEVPATSLPLADDVGPPPLSAPPAEHVGLPGYTPDNELRVMAVLKAAWAMVSGVKIPIWIGVLVIIALVAGVEAALAVILPSAVTLGGEALVVWIQIVSQLLETVLVLAVLAGLYAIGVCRVRGTPFSWRTVLSGFPHLGRIAVAGLLMSLLIMSGFFLLVLPGIYLAVGYSLTLPLMVEKGYGPWEAMETSRRVIHRKWWQVFGLYLTMYLIYLVSCIPFGIGLVWTIPMLFTLTGVLYCALMPEPGSR